VTSLRALDDPAVTLAGGGDLTGRDLLEISEKALGKLDKALSDALQKADGTSRPR
jgi:hypothetical protein